MIVIKVSTTTTTIKRIKTILDSSPVVEEDVGPPDAAGRNAHVLDVAVVGRIPSQVVVNPILAV